MLDAQYRERLDAYLSLHRPHVNIKAFLGDGTDGAVWSTERDTAIKVFSAWRGYQNERFTYQELKRWGITQQIAGFWIPEMHGFDDELQVVEMDLMQNPPYIIDFAKVRFTEPDYSPETERDNDERGRERFGDNWPEVQRLLSALESYRIFYVDPTPYNIVFPEVIPPDT